MEHAKEQERVHTARECIEISSDFRLLCHQIIRWKHCHMTHLIQVKGKNQTSTWHTTLN